MADLTLYTNPRSRGRLARFMLEEVGAPYDVKVLEYGPPMKAPEYLALNPMGKVPTVVHNGAVVTECAAICAYLADAFPEAGLAPAPAERAAYYRWLFFGAGPVEAAMTARGLKMEPSAEVAGQVGYGSVALVVETLRRELAKTPFVTGETFTAADVYLGSQVSWALEWGLLEADPVLAAYAERIKSREAYGRAAALDDAMVPKAATAQ